MTNGTYPTRDDEYYFSDWLNDQMREKDISIKDIAERSGITYTGIWNIVQGNTWSPRSDTRKRIADAIHSIVPADVEAASEAEAVIMAPFEWVPCDPFDIQSVPECPGVYVFYDLTDRPVYVGQSTRSIRGRVLDHRTRFWYKSPLVHRLSVIEIRDLKLCVQIEKVLISFLGAHALPDFNSWA